MGFATSSLKEAGIGIGILVIVIAVMAKVLTTVQDTNTVNSTAYNITDLGLSALDTFSDWFAVIVIVLIATVVIALLTFGFGRGRA